MALPIPPIQDVVRLIGSDVRSTAENYRRHLRRGGGAWGYDPAKRQARAVFSLIMSRGAAVRACGQRGHPLGRASNEEVGGLIWDLASRHGKFLCTPTTARLLNLRSDVSITVDPLFYFVDAGKPHIFYLQPRRTHVPGPAGLRLIASAIKSVFCVDEFEQAELVLFDLSARVGSTERVAQEYDFGSLKPYDESEMEVLFQRFVDAYDIVDNEGITITPRPRPSKDRTDEPNLFGDDT